MEYKNNEEEADLGSVFSVIGKGIANLANFIGGIFKGLFHFLMISLLFVKQNMIKLGIAFVLGAGLGLIIELNEENQFGSNLLVQTNFNSARQLYSNIDYYNNLVKQQKTPLLAEIFNISEEEALSLKEFTILPIKNGNDIITTYDELLLSVDSLTVKSYSFADFKRAFTKFNYKVHDIEVKSTKNNVFHKLDEVIIAAIVENNYFNKLKELTNENLNRTDNLLRRNLAQTDSLHQVYKAVLLEKAKHGSQGTTIEMGGKEQQAAELELFKTTLKLNKELKTVSKEKTEKSEVVNIISNFQPVGYEIKGVYENRSVQLALLFLVAMIGYLLLLKLNRYLDTYKQ